MVFFPSSSEWSINSQLIFVSYTKGFFLYAGMIVNTFILIY